MSEENNTESKALIYLRHALPCPYCGADNPCFGINTIDEAYEDGDEFVGRFYCGDCGASTRGVLLGCYDNGKKEDLAAAEKALAWSLVLAAWNRRAPSVPVRTPPPRVPLTPARTKPEKPPASSRIINL